ncbi:hypothetical protein LINPERPRIM_LOCUS4854 [Linum perenne]
MIGGTKPLESLFINILMMKPEIGTKTLGNM